MKLQKKSRNVKLLYLALLIGVAVLAMGYLIDRDSDSGYDLEEITGTYVAEVTTAPEVPPAITRDEAKRVIVKLETKETTLPIAPGVEYATAWTFNGTIPGPMVRVREGDLVEVHLSNAADSKMAHNIDLHAVMGPGGGAEASLTPPGQTTKFSFRALKPGLYIYHCAAPPVGIHISNGMYGMILVEPKEGLEPVDREYYIVQSEFYTTGENGETGLQAFDFDKALAEQPEYVVFNGNTESLVADNTIYAEAGETVRLFVGNAGPGLISSFHVIGEVFDKVQLEGGSFANHNVQTTMIPVGGASIIEFKVDVPGSYTLTDHAIFRAFNKGALGQLKVTGEENEKIFSDQVEPGTAQLEQEEDVKPLVSYNK